jgi:4-diphosphocytidyl-2-C-methyl-D-erythritol kinase
VLLNDLEKITTAAYPEIERIKKELIVQGASAAMMSGSGPTVFAVFEDRGQAESCRELFKERYTSTFVVSPLTGSGHLE